MYLSKTSITHELSQILDLMLKTAINIRDINEDFKKKYNEFYNKYSADIAVKKHIGFDKNLRNLLIIGL